MGPKFEQLGATPMVTWVTSLNVGLGSTADLTDPQVTQVLLSEGLRKGAEALDHFRNQQWVLVPSV